MKDLEFLDILNIMSFAIGVENLNENLSQGQAGDMLKIAVEDIHKHLQEQDEKLDRLEELLNETYKKVSEQDK